MKRTIITLHILMISVLFAFGQETTSKAKLSYGEEFADKRFNFINEMFYSNESGYYALSKNIRSVRNAYDLYHFSKDLDLIDVVELDLYYKDNTLDFRFAKMINEKLYVFTSFRNDKTDKYYLFCQPIDPKRLETVGDPKVIAEIDFSGHSRYFARLYDVKISRDSSKILVYYNLPYDKKENEQFGFVVYDNNFKRLWKRDVELQYADELIDLQYYQPDNNGNVHVVAKVYNEKSRESRKGKPNFKYVILNYLNDNSDANAYVVNIDQKFVTDLIITSANPENIQCTGFYSNLGTQSIVGTFYITFNSLTNETITQKIEEFDIGFLTKGMSKKKTKKAKKKKSKGKDFERKYFELRDLIIKQDGGIILLGEQSYTVVQRSTTSSGQVTTRVYDYFNDVIIVSFDKNGEVLWTDKVHKFQKTDNTEIGMVSYGLITNSDKLGILYQDNPVNRGRKSTIFVWSNLKQYDLVLHEIDVQGKSKKSYLTTYKKSKLWLFPRNFIQVSATELVFPGMKKRKKKLVKLQMAG